MAERQVIVWKEQHTKPQSDQVVPEIKEENQLTDYNSEAYTSYYSPVHKTNDAVIATPATISVFNRQEYNVHHQLQIIAVEDIAKYQLCLKCLSPTTQLPDEDDITTCNCCGTLQFLDTTYEKIRADFFVKTSAENILPVTAYDTCLSNIIGVDSYPTKMNLLKSHSFCSYIQNGTIIKVFRCY